MAVHLFDSSVRDVAWRWFDLKLDVGNRRVQTIYVSNQDLEYARPQNARVHLGQDIDTARQTDIFTTERVLRKFTRSAL